MYSVEESWLPCDICSLFWSIFFWGHPGLDSLEQVAVLRNVTQAEEILNRIYILTFSFTFGEMALVPWNVKITESRNSYLTSIEQKTKDLILTWVPTVKFSFHFNIQYCSFFFLRFFFPQICKFSIYKSWPRLEGWTIKLNLILWGWAGWSPNSAVLYTYQDLVPIYGHVCRDRGLTAHFTRNHADPNSVVLTMFILKRDMWFFDAALEWSDHMRMCFS